MDHNINTSLKRTIKPGREYEKYFTASKCEIAYLGEGDTDLTLRKMRSWTYRFADHAKSLALGEFANKDLLLTVSNIHRFLFEHLQYEMDGSDQRLKSPGCAWATRRAGLDCKSYSLFASAILKNLGIKHYFRKVKQPNFNWPQQGLNPKLWSHVYVIIPKDQNTLRANRPSEYLILDATVGNNREVVFTDKKDLLMDKVSLKHYGLAGANGLNACSCKEKSKRPFISSTRSGGQRSIRGMEALRAASQEEQQLFQKAFDKFSVYLDTLIANGMPASHADLAISRLRKFIKAGIEPTMKELFAIPVKGLGAPGDITAPLLTNINQLPISSSIRQASTRTPKGANLGTISTALSVVTSIIPAEIYDKTFGALFANGFNFKCWGASWNPDKAKKTVELELPLIKQRAAQVLQVPWSQFEKAINDFWVFFYSVRSTQRDWLATTAKDCTKDGLQILIGSIDAIKGPIKASFDQHVKANGHQLTRVANVTKKYPAEKHTGRHALTQAVEQYKFTFVTPIVPVNNPVFQPRTPSLSDSFIDNNGNLVVPNNQNKNNEPEKQLAGFGWVAGGLIAAIAIGTIVNNKQNKEK